MDEEERVMVLQLNKELEKQDKQDKIDEVQRIMRKRGLYPTDWVELKGRR